MRTLAKTAVALSFVGATAIATTATAQAEGFYFNAPGIHIGVGYPHYHRPYYNYYGGGGWNTWNGCPPMYTIQGGNCAPYKGPVYGPGWGYYR